MKSHSSRFLHPTPSHSNGKPQSTPILPSSNLPRISRWKNLAYISTDGWYGDNNNHRGYGYYGDKYCTDDLTCLRDLTMDDIYTLCTNHIGANDSLFSYAFD